MFVSFETRFNHVHPKNDQELLLYIGLSASRAISLFLFLSTVDLPSFLMLDLLTFHRHMFAVG